MHLVYMSIDLNVMSLIDLDLGFDTENKEWQKNSFRTRLRSGNCSETDAEHDQTHNQKKENRLEQQNM